MYWIFIGVGKFKVYFMQINSLNESRIERYAIELFVSQGFEYIHGSNRAPDSNNSEYQSFEEIILLGRLNSTIHKINLSIPYDTQQDAINLIIRINSLEIISNYQLLHRTLAESINIVNQRNFLLFKLMNGEVLIEDMGKN